MWKSRSNAASSTQTGNASPNGTIFTFWRRRGARCRRDANTCSTSSNRSRPSGRVEGSSTESPATCMCIAGRSKYRNDASSAVRRSVAIGPSPGGLSLARQRSLLEPPEPHHRTAPRPAWKPVLASPAMRRRLRAVTLLAAPFVLALPSTPARATSDEGYRAVEVRDNVFAPPIVRVAVGGTIEWTNEGRNTHDVTTDEG